MSSSGSSILFRERQRRGDAVFLDADLDLGEREGVSEPIFVMQISILAGG